MSATVSGSKTVSNDVNPTIKASALTTIMSTAVENLTVAQHNTLQAALECKQGGLEPNATIGSFFS